jgi:hypothetical protein
MSSKNSDVVALDVTASLREAYTTAISTALETQENNIRFAQRVFETSVDELKNQAESARRVGQVVAQQSQKQRATFDALAQQSATAYVDYLHSALATYQKGLEIIRHAID